MAVVEPASVERFLEICEKWDVEATVVGEVDESGRLTIEWHGETVVDVPPRSVAHDGPTYQRPFARPDWQDVLQADTGEALERPTTGDELRATLLRLVASPNLCDKSWITDQYDRYVQGNTVLAQPEDSGMVRVDPDSGLGVAVATDCNGRFAKLDPYAGAQLALAESYRNVATGGARPLAVSDCLNFGSPEDPAVMWQFAEATRGLADGCQALGIPVTGGNVSLYNQTGETAILPTPVVAVLGVIDDVDRRTPTGFRARASRSTCSAPPATSWPARSGRTSCTATSAACRRRSTWRPSASSPTSSSTPRATGSSTPPTTSPTAASPRRWWSRCLRHGVGARVWLPDDLDPFVALFCESAARVVVAVPRSEEVRFTDMCSARGFPHARIGVTDGEGDDAALDVQGQFTVPLAEVRAAWSATLPDALG